jgi:hypothetical protein
VNDPLTQASCVPVCLPCRVALGHAACQEWLDCVDFLQQCEPRLFKLIEVGAAGDNRIPEELFERLLSVNDAVHTVLDGKPIDVVSAMPPRFGLSHPHLAARSAAKPNR